MRGSPITFHSGRIRQITYDASQGQLEITWDNKTVTAYRPVPQEIFLRLSKAPNPATYFEDRIAEEYPKVEPAKKQESNTAAKKLNDLFGG